MYGNVDDIGEDDAVQTRRQSVNQPDDHHEGRAGELRERQELREELPGTLGKIDDHAERQEELDLCAEDAAAENG